MPAYTMSTKEIMISCLFTLMDPYHTTMESVEQGMVWHYTEMTSEKGPMGEHVEAYNTEMKALEVALRLIHEIVNSMETPPSKIILATDNMGALQRIFQGSPGKAQKCSDTFHKHIIDILDQHTNVQFVFTWCPGHFDIEGNERADQLTKPGSRLTHKIPYYKSLYY